MLGRGPTYVAQNANEGRLTQKSPPFKPLITQILGSQARLFRKGLKFQISIEYKGLLEHRAANCGLFLTTPMAVLEKEISCRRNLSKLTRSPSRSCAGEVFYRKKG